jgi:hypothetical protein
LRRLLGKDSSLHRNGVLLRATCQRCDDCYGRTGDDDSFGKTASNFERTGCIGILLRATWGWCNNSL